MVIGRLRSFLSEPATYFQSTKEIWGFVSAMGLFVFAFLTFFQPFGVNNYDPTETLSLVFVLMMLFFGGITTVWLAINEFILRKRLNIPNTRGALTLWIGWSLISLGTTMFLVYNILGEWHDFRLSSYLEFVFNISVTGIFPIIICLFYLNYRKIKNSRQEPATSTPQAEEPLVSLISENEKERLAIRLSQIRYIESQDNYAAIFFLENEQLKKKLIRSTLKRLEQQIEDYPIHRTHRSYMVNLSKVISYKGNQHSLQLTIEDLQMTLPVSRTYVDKVLKYIESHK